MNCVWYEDWLSTKCNATAWVSTVCPEGHKEFLCTKHWVYIRTLKGGGFRCDECNKFYHLEEYRFE